MARRLRKAGKKGGGRRKKTVAGRFAELRRTHALAGAVALAALSVAAIAAFDLQRGGDPADSAAAPETAPPAPAEPAAGAPPAPEVSPPAAEEQVAAVPPPPAIPRAAWQRHAISAKVAPGQPMIAIVIDDMGLDRSRSQQAVDLPGPLTLAYLTYARNLDAQTRAARGAGHELLVHVPMEPGGAADPGPNAVTTALPPDELDRRIDWNLSRFDRFVGINNHMGSKATSSRPVMTAVMARLRERGLLFLDSRTSSETVAQSEARRQGIPALRRDVFLDHDPSPIAVRAALFRVEDLAKSRGHAIAIGHPKDATIEALAEWLPDVRARGFALVPVSAIAERMAGADR